MKAIYRTVCICFFSVASACPSFAQDDLEQLLNESVEDGRKLINAYMTPFMNSVSLGLNQGWYNTAATHKVAGVDLTITVNAMTVPKSDLFFDVNKLNLQVIDLEATSPDYPLAPTVLGPDRAPI